MLESYSLRFDFKHRKFLKIRIKKEAELLKESKESAKKASETTSEAKSSKKLKGESSATVVSTTATLGGASFSLDNSNTKFYGKANIPSEDIANFFSAITILNQNLNQPKQSTATTINQIDHDYLGMPVLCDI